MPPLIELIPDDAIDFTPEPPEFEALAVQHLTGLENVEGAIDMDLLDVAAAVDEAPVFLADIDTEHNELVAQAPEIAQDETTPLEDDLNTQVEVGDRNLRNVDGSLLVGSHP